MNFSSPGNSAWAANTYAPANGHNANAYISVPARHTFGPPSSFSPPPPPLGFTAPPLPLQQAYISPTPPNPAPMTTSVSQPVKKKTVWSPEVRDYVNRSFAVENSINGIAKEQVEAKLKEVITEAQSSGTLDTRNWQTYLLPQQILQQEKTRVLLAPIPSPFVPTHFPSADSSHAPHQSQSHGPRKRKSTELSSEGDSGSIPPWRMNAQPSGSLADRVSFTRNEKRAKVDTSKSVSKTNSNLVESRRKRFEDVRVGSNSPRTQESSRGGSPEPQSTGPVIGRSQKLEKNYFRLTSAPNPDDVRPLEVLKKTLELLKKKWRADANYVYICDQFKSLRQDLTVQHIKNDFTTSVYEYHARIALEKGDLGEYNQCQTQLRALYKQNLGGHRVEFTAYRILYFIHTCNRTDMNDVLSDLTEADKKETAVKHALEVRSALALGNYHKFFKLYLTVPAMGAYLMDMFVERERLAALACLCRSYKPDVKLRFITEELGFETDEEACQFLLDHVPEESPTLLEERDGDVRFLTGKAGSIFHVAKTKAFGHVDIKGQI